MAESFPWTSEPIDGHMIEPPPSSTSGTTAGTGIQVNLDVQDTVDILAHVQKVWDGIRPNSTIYRLLLSELQWVSASHGRIIVRLRLQPVHLNSKRTLHGSVSATIVDWAGGMAIASTGLQKTGVSTDIHISYVSTAKDNDMIEIEAWVSRVGRSLAYTMVEIRKVGGDLGNKGPIVCTGSHTKYLV
ncbi:Thioesterase/thiol ester dehydrase-isomerase [Coniochaeta ligniaria NRRL 30616]|uniref:Thioesterase/thiol ester dehydrase-isomerase n=1 Tax=Coniochaeta ligniaria NRRL 30616 TaxID=1408157 RepID=A0A1J7J7V3_9PEZI|nr:Thioesterase/thiol ester dehydrase-isomerase [Coniochaeta ligniaria NRRL 30616]